jgi:hypothetical protein
MAENNLTMTDMASKLNAIAGSIEGLKDLLNMLAENADTQSSILYVASETADGLNERVCDIANRLERLSAG